jgi:hypothetical protein
MQGALLEPHSAHPCTSQLSRGPPSSSAGARSRRSRGVGSWQKQLALGRSGAFLRAGRGAPRRACAGSRRARSAHDISHRSVPSSQRSPAPAAAGAAPSAAGDAAPAALQPAPAPPSRCALAERRELRPRRRPGLALRPRLRLRLRLRPGERRRLRLRRRRAGSGPCRRRRSSVARTMSRMGGTSTTSCDWYALPSTTAPCHARPRSAPLARRALGPLGRGPSQPLAVAQSLI